MSGHPRDRPPGTRRPDAPAAVWTREELLAGGTVDGRRPPAAPRGAGARARGRWGRRNHALAWAGDRLVVWGGQDADGPAAGYAWVER